MNFLYLTWRKPETLRYLHQSSSYENYDNRWFGIFHSVFNLFFYGGYPTGDA